MNWGNYLLMSIVIIFTNYLLFKCYENVEDTIRFKGFKHVSILLISSLLMILNYFVVPFISRPLFTYILYLICLKFIYGKDIKNVIIKGTFVYAIYLIFDFILSVIVLFSGQAIVNNLDNDIIFKSLFTTLIIVVTYFSLRISLFRKISDKINNIINKKTLLIMLMILFFIFVFLSSLRFHYLYNYKSYLISLFFLFCFILLLSLSIFDNLKIDSINKQNDTLLEFLFKYEKTIDENRICKHEMLNNLILLKNYSNKNSKEYSELLDDLIEQYNNKSDDTIKNISKLPKGLKGVLYYKINDMRIKNINVNVKISSQINKYLKNLSKKNYYDLSKIVGIVMDNACEAAFSSKGKHVLVDVYLCKKDVIISIENTYKGSVNMKKINSKGYSSKAKGRGYGLFIVSEILRNNNNIEFYQEITSKVFITKIMYKKNPIL